MKNKNEYTVPVAKSEGKKLLVKTSACRRNNIKTELNNMMEE
jgi:hypothetical protein